MNLKFGIKGYTYGIISAICWTVAVILGFFNIGIISLIANCLVFIFVILAIFYGKKEYIVDSTNKKAKIGKTIGLIIIILEFSFPIIIAIITYYYNYF